MRKTFFVLMALAASTAPAAAQTFGFGAHAGVSFPTGDYADGVNTGFSGGLDLWYPLGDSGLSWYTSVDAVAHDVDSDDTDSGFLYFPLLTGARFDIPAGPVTIFATGQAGLVLTKGPSFDGMASAAGGDSKLGASFGFSAGAGVQITEYVYAGAKYYPLGTVEFKYDNDQSFEGDVSFFDIYVGFGVR